MKANEILVYRYLFGKYFLLNMQIYTTFQRKDVLMQKSKDNRRVIIVIFIEIIAYITNSTAYESRKFNATFTRAVQ